MTLNSQVDGFMLLLISGASFLKSEIDSNFHIEIFLHDSVEAQVQSVLQHLVNNSFILMFWN